MLNLWVLSSKQGVRENLPAGDETRTQTHSTVPDTKYMIITISVTTEIMAYSYYFA